MIQIQAAVVPAALAAEPLVDVPVLSEPRAYLQVYAHELEVVETAKGTAVVVGITGTCPYGIGACWGGAYEALRGLQGVELVSPVPNTDDSTAEVFLIDDHLPPLEEWHKQFRRFVNGTYEMRGVEVTLKGDIEEREGNLFLAGRGQRPYVRLAPLRATDKVQWNHTIRERKPMDPDEALAYERLAVAVTGLSPGQQVTITGPLNQTPAGYQLYLRLF